MIIETVYDENGFACEQPMELTNEQYIQTCSTEELAEVIAKRIINTHTMFEYILHQDNRREEDVKREVLEWLKQPHREENEK